MREDAAGEMIVATQAELLRRRRQIPGWLRTPWAPALTVLAFYGVWLLLCFAAGHQARDFIWIGRSFVEKSHASTVIVLDPAYHGYVPNGVGYDGQFSYYIALDPGNARYYMDSPLFPTDYRYTRIVYPLLARALALGQPAIIPYTLLFINWLAVAGGTFAAGAWLRRKGRSPWLALIYGLYPGLFLATWRDLTEPVAYGLVALAVYLFDFGGRRRILYAGVSFALAALARETTLLFAVLYALSLLSRGEFAASWRQRLAGGWRSAALLIGLAAGPFIAYKLFLRIWLGALGISPLVYPRLIPLQGVFAYWPWDSIHQLEVEFIVTPALLCAALGVWALWKRMWSVEVCALLANILFFVILLAPSSYADLYAVARISTGVVLAAVYCLPAFGRMSRPLRVVFAVASGLWLFLFPVWVVGSLAFWPVL